MAKKILMFYLSDCPHCVGAMRYEDELRRENPAYRALQIERIDEAEDPKTADEYDYYWVPTYYVDGVKAHEGRNTKADVRKVFDAAAGLNGGNVF
jgi:glutaredoxin